MTRDINDTRMNRAIIRARRAFVETIYRGRETEAPELSVADATRLLLEKPRRARKQTKAHRKLNPHENRQIVYVIGSAHGPVKIGYAKDVRQRLRELQVGSPMNLEIHATVSVGVGRGPVIEAICHRELAQYRLRGEWFDLCPAVAAYEIKRIYAENGPLVANPRPLRAARETTLRPFDCEMQRRDGACLTH